MISACSQVAATADRSKAPDFYCPLLLAPCHMMPLHPQPEATTNDDFFKKSHRFELKSRSAVLPFRRSAFSLS